MARVDKVPVEFEYSLASLTSADLRVLDLAMSYFTDRVKQNPTTLPDPGDTEVLASLHQLVLDIKRGG